MEIRALRRGRRDRRELRLLRHLGEPHHVPDGPAGAVQRLRRRLRQRLVWHGLPHAPARSLPRRRLPGPLPSRHHRLHPLRAGVWYADAVGDGAGAAAVAHSLQGGWLLLLLLSVDAGVMPARVGAGGLLLRVPVPDRHRAGRRQAVRAGVRGGPVRRRARGGARLPRLPLQLVVLLHGHGHLRVRLRGGLHPGVRRVGARLRRPLRHRALRLPRLPAGHPDVPPLRAHAGSQVPVPPPGTRPGHRPVGQDADQSRSRSPSLGLPGRRRRGRRRAVRAAPASHLGVQPGVRRGVRADHDAVQQAGAHPGPSHRTQPGAASGGSADAGPREHPAVRARVRPRRGARAAVGDGQPVGAEHAAARGRGHGDVAGGRGGGGAGGVAAAGDGAGARAGGRPVGDGAHELGVDRAAVRHDGGGGRAGGGGPAGALLRPDARRAPQPGAGALPQRHGHRGVHQQPAHLRHRRRHRQRRRGQLVRRQPQPGAPRLLLLAAGGAQRRGARALPLLRALPRLQAQVRVRQQQHQQAPLLHIHLRAAWERLLLAPVDIRFLLCLLQLYCSLLKLVLQVQMQRLFLLLLYVLVLVNKSKLSCRAKNGP